MYQTRYDRQQQRAVQSRRLIRRRHLIRESIITVIIVVVILVLGIQLFHAHQQKVQLHHQVQIDRVELSREKAMHRQLKLNVKQMHSKTYLEQLIRQRYGYSKPGETIYSLPGDVAKDVTHE